VLASAQSKEEWNGVVGVRVSNNKVSGNPQRQCSGVGQVATEAAALVQHPMGVRLRMYLHVINHQPDAPPTPSAAAIATADDDIFLVCLLASP
jgi:hypothetical protein